MKKKLLFVCAAVFVCGISFAQEYESQDYDEHDFDDIMEGEGLTVESETDPAKEAVSGVSVVLDREQMKTTSQIGLVEDVMSSVNTLPGITYNGNWNSEPSIRGGYPREMCTVLDGVYILYPWHWGGSYSIFNPHMVDSVKMSNGVFSSRYGRAMSGLMEVCSVKSDGKFHLDLNLTSIATDIFVQIPFGQNAGLFAGGKITYMEGYIGLFRAISTSDVTDMLKRVPYIRDFYTKAFWNPSDDLNITLNAFYGSDGIRISSDDTEDGEHLTNDFDYNVQQAFVGLNMKWLPASNFQLQAIGSYNWTFEDLKFDGSVDGEFKYNDDFINRYGFLLDDSNSYEKNGKRYFHLDTQEDHMKEKVVAHQLQGKLEATIELNDTNSISFGAEEVWSRADTTELMNSWIERNFGSDPYPSFMPAEYSIDAEGNQLYTTAGYALWNFGDFTSFFSGEAGVRVDHVYLNNDPDDFSINTVPHVNPRVSVQITPIRARNCVDKLTFSAGCGLFTGIPMELMLVDKKMDIKDYEVSPNHAVFGVLGTELKMENDWSFKLEGYYKHYLNRLYVVMDDRNPTDTKVDAKTDGQGWTMGFDLMVEKKGGEKLDGYLSYSFVVARYKNPYTKLFDDQVASNGDPLDEWFYPDFHRFHTLNAVVNWKFAPKWTLTVKGTFASGTPRKENGKIYCYPALLADGTVQQRYTRSSFYSDSLRTEISCPIDLRLGYRNDFGKNGAFWEWYIGAEDIFLNLYSPKGESTFNARTGKDNGAAQSANFNIGIPMISTGVKLSI